MLIIGEKINTINPQVRQAVEDRDAAFLKDLALAQAQAGAHVIDVNVGSRPSVEPENMRWAVELVQEVVDLPLSIDSSDPAAVRAGLEVCQNPSFAWANSVNLDRARLEGVLPVVAELGCHVIGLCMDERGVPSTAAGRATAGQRMVEEIDRWGVPVDRLYLDALVEPISVTPAAARVSLETIQALRAALPDVKTVICLTAISFGLPARRLLNRTFLPLLLAAGVDAVILDPLDKPLMSTIRAANALLGRDEHGLAYIAAHRAGRLV
jgi:5-methyltetrahydrofolate--homocysteine methyltransferase